MDPPERHATGKSTLWSPESGGPTGKSTQSTPHASPNGSVDVSGRSTRGPVPQRERTSSSRPELRRSPQLAKREERVAPFSVLYDRLPGSLGHICLVREPLARRQPGKGYPSNRDRSHDWRSSDPEDNVPEDLPTHNAKISCARGVRGARDKQLDLGRWMVEAG